MYFLLLGISFAGCQKENTPLVSTKTDIWKRAEEEVYKSVKELKAQHKAEKNRNQVYSNKFFCGKESNPFVAFTFDDGPHPAYTPRIIEVLNRYQAKGTFFIVGKMAEKYPELVKSIYDNGHLVANHTYHHVNLTKIPTKEIMIEWQACNDIIKNITGNSPLFCRPPGGDYDQYVMEAAKDLNLTVALWSINPGDYENPGESKIKEIILKKAKSGSVVLLHDGIEETIKVLPDILQQLRTKGYQLVDLNTMKSKNK